MQDGPMVAALALTAALAIPHVATAKATGDEGGPGLGPPGVERGPCSAEPGRAATTADEAGTANRLVGEAIAIDPAAGVAMLSTERGVVAVHGSPEMMAQVGVGDVVVVETDEDAASPREQGDGAASPGEQCL